MWAPKIATLDDNWREALEIEPFSLVFFWAVWSRPDQRLSVVLEVVQSRFNQRIAFYAVDLDTEIGCQIAIKTGVMTNPTCVFFRFGALQKTSIGYRSEDDFCDALEIWLQT